VGARRACAALLQHWSTLGRSRADDPDAHPWLRIRDPVARAIREANMIPTSGGPNRREKIGSEHLALLIIGWCLDSPIHELPDEV
jgi:hypothetical protein